MPVSMETAALGRSTYEVGRERLGLGKRRRGHLGEIGWVVVVGEGG